MIAAPDAELLALGRELREAYAIEKVETEAATTDEELYAATARTAGLCAKILQLPARTLEGLRVKAVAIDVCQAGFDGLGEDTTDVRLATSLVEDLLEIERSSP